MQRQALRGCEVRWKHGTLCNCDPRVGYLTRVPNTDGQECLLSLKGRLLSVDEVQSGGAVISADSPIGRKKAQTRGTLRDHVGYARGIFGDVRL